MLVELTVEVPADSPVVQWARTQKNSYAAMGHVGTHLDRYEKTKIPLEYFKSDGVLFNVVGRDEVQICDVDLEKIKPGSFVLFRTGRIEEHEYGSREYFADHPQLSHELIEKLAESGIRFIGVDCAGIRRGAEHEPADRLCEKNGIYVIENLADLGRIESESFTVYAAWRNEEGLTGLPCRVIVEI